jgi:hypothetical protein
MQAWNFMSGYRMTADDIYFQNIFFDGIKEIFFQSHQLAVSQGRIGQYVSVPLVILGSYWADVIWVRAIYVAIYFLLFFLISKFIANSIKADITLLLFTLMVSLTNLGPQEFNHLPPTAYPLLISIPFLIIISVKLWRQSYSQHLSRQNKLRNTIYCLLMLLAMLFNEYAFLFGVGLILVQYFCDVNLKDILNREFNFSKVTLKNRQLFFDGLIALIAFLIYLIFRINFPSTYDGNTPDGLMRLPNIFYTLIGHIFSGTSIPFLLGWKTQLVQATDLAKLIQITSQRQIFIAAIFGAISGSIMFIALKRSASSIAIPTIYWAIVGAFLYSIIVTIPNAITLKYQEWCSLMDCIYIDTRISYYGFIAALVFVILLLLKIFPSKSKLFFISRLFLCCILGAFASHTYLNNEVIKLSMQEYTKAWERAQLQACSNNVEQSNPKFLQNLDPNKLIHYHPGFQVDKYWINYIQDYKVRKGCITRQ